jgi:hypothetical protein
MTTPGPAVTADLPEVVDARGAGDIDAPHTLDDRTGAVGDLPAATQHHGVAAADIELCAGQHVDRHIGAAGLRDDARRHRIGLAAVAGHRLRGRGGERRAAGGACRLGRAGERGRANRQSRGRGTHAQTHER